MLALVEKTDLGAFAGPDKGILENSRIAEFADIEDIGKGVLLASISFLISTVTV